MTIWKFPLLLSDDVQELKMSADAEILTVQMHCGRPYLWARCDDTRKIVKRSVVIYGADSPASDDVCKYISTFQTHGGALVFHVFEVIE